MGNCFSGAEVRDLSLGGMWPRVAGRKEGEFAREATSYPYFHRRHGPWRKQKRSFFFFFSLTSTSRALHPPLNNINNNNKTSPQPSPGSKRVSVASRGSAASFASSSRSLPPFEDFLVLKGQSPPPPPVTDLFTLGRVLGRGAFGVTRLAKERATGDAAAVKTIARRRIAASMPDHAERVRCEVEAMRRVSGHPHIVALKSCHEDEKGVHLAMVRKEFFCVLFGVFVVVFYYFYVSSEESQEGRRRRRKGKVRKMEEKEKKRKNSLFLNSTQLHSTQLNNRSSAPAVSSSTRSPSAAPTPRPAPRSSSASSSASSRTATAAGSSTGTSSPKTCCWRLRSRGPRSRRSTSASPRWSSPTATAAAAAAREPEKEEEEARAPLPPPRPPLLPSPPRRPSCARSL